MLEIHISWSTWFVVATTNNKRLKKMNFDNLWSNYELGASGLSRCWCRSTNYKEKTRELMLYFPFYEHFTLKNYSALGLMYIWQLFRIFITSFQHILVMQQHRIDKKNIGFFTLLQQPQTVSRSKSKKKVRTAEKTNLNKDFRDQWMVATDSNSPVLKIKAPVP